MPFIIDDIAIAATEMSEVAAETAEIAGEVTESSEIIGDGIGESSLVNEKVIDAGESLNPTVSEPTEIIGDGVGETALESPESGIEQSKQVVNDNSKILGDGVVEGEETSMIENNIAIENSSTPPDIDDARLDKREQVVQNKIGDVDEKDSSITNSEIIDEACETKKEGVSEEKRQELKELGWSDEVIGYIASDAEAEIYQKAGLVEVEINGKKALVRNDIDFEQKDEFGLSNKERMESGHTPINKNGEVIVLHHIGQKPDSPLAELTKSEHMGNGNDTILHDKSKSSEVHNSENEGTWRKERNEHWKSRANNNI